MVNNTPDVIHVYKTKQEEPARKGIAGWRKENVGIFDTMRSLLNERFINRGRKNPTEFNDFDVFLEDVKTFHPKATRKLVKMYIADKRQFGPNLTWDGYKESIVMRSEINYIPKRAAKTQNKHQ